MAFFGSLNSLKNAHGYKNVSAEGAKFEYLFEKSL